MRVPSRCRRLLAPETLQNLGGVELSSVALSSLKTAIRAKVSTPFGLKNGQLAVLSF